LFNSYKMMHCCCRLHTLPRAKQEEAEEGCPQQGKVQFGRQD
jgi:hypothetical protein